MFTSAVQRLDAALRDLGIPIDGVSGPNETPPNFTVSYGAGATSEQIAAGNLLAADFDVRTYQSKPLGVIASELQALGASDRQIVADATQAFVLASNQRIDSMVKTLLAMNFSAGQQTTLKIGTAAALIAADARFAVRLGVNVPGDMPVA